MFGNSQTVREEGGRLKGNNSPTFLYFLSRAGSLLLVSWTTGISNAVFSMQDAITVFH